MLRRRKLRRSDIAQSILYLGEGPVLHGFVGDAQSRTPRDVLFDVYRLSLYSLHEDEEDIRLAVLRDVTYPDFLGSVATLHDAHMTVLMNGRGDHAADELARLCRVVYFRPGAHRKIRLVAVQLDEPGRRLLVGEYVALHQPRRSTERSSRLQKFDRCANDCGRVSQKTVMRQERLPLFGARRYRREFCII